MGICVKLTKKDLLKIRHMKKNEQHLIEIKQALHKLNLRLLSIEQWLADLSKGKNLNYSERFKKDITDLDERMHPTVTIKELQMSTPVLMEDALE